MQCDFAHIFESRDSSDPKKRFPYSTQGAENKNFYCTTLEAAAAAAEALFIMHLRGVKSFAIA